MKYQREQQKPIERAWAAAPLHWVGNVQMVWFAAAALASLSGLSSCSIAPNMAGAAPQGTELGGFWSLDRRESDDVRARLLPLIEKKERRWRTFEKRMPEDVFAPPPESADGSTMQWMRRQRQQEAEVLIAFVAPPTQLDIQMSTRDGRQEIRVKTDKGEGTRVLVPGQSSSLFFAIGGFEVHSGWHKGAFVVDLKGSGDNSMQIVQYYTVTDAGKRLDMRMETRLPELGKESFHFIYKRTGSQ